MANDPFDLASDNPSGPSRAPFAVGPHDSASLPVVPKRIFVGSGGDVTLRGVNGTEDVVYRNVANGVYLNVRPSHIRATGTTASDIIGEM